MLRPARGRRSRKGNLRRGVLSARPFARSAKNPGREDLRGVSAKSQEPQQERPSLLSYPRLRADRALWKNAPTGVASSALPHELEGPPRIIRKHAPHKGDCRKCDARSASREESQVAVTTARGALGPQIPPPRDRARGATGRIQGVPENAMREARAAGRSQVAAKTARGALAPQIAPPRDQAHFVRAESRTRGKMGCQGASQRQGLRRCRATAQT